MAFTVTLQQLRDAKACLSGYKTLRLAMQDEYTGIESFDMHTPIPITYIINSNGIDDAIWALRCVKDHDKDIRMFAVWCARQVQHLMTDGRSIRVLDIIEAYLDSGADSTELEKARIDAAAAASASDAAAAYAAAAAAAAAAYSASDAAAYAAAYAASASYAAVDMRIKQANMLELICNNLADWQV